MMEIAKIMLGELTASLKDNGVAFTYDADILDYRIATALEAVFGYLYILQTA